MVGMTNAETATSATKVAAIIDAAEALATAEECPAEEPPPDDLPPLPLPLPIVGSRTAAEEGTDAPLPEDESDESLSRLLSFFSATFSSVFSQYTVGNSS